MICASVALGVVSYLSYPGSSERAVRLCTSVLLLYAVAAPISGAIRYIADFNIEDIAFENSDAPMGSEEYLEVTRAAFEEGISRLVSEKYGISLDDMQVVAFDFEFKEMKAKKIKILLLGKGIFADRRAIESYVTESGLGECEVNIQIG